MIRVWIQSIVAAAGRLQNCARGSVAVIGALSLTTIVGMSAFAVEAGQGYAAKVSSQRIADQAALAGALAYNVNNSTSEMTATATAVVAAQGLPASDAAVALTTDATSGKQLVQVTITTSVPLSLGRVFTSNLSYNVSSVGSATTSTTANVTPPCIAALSATPTYGVNLSGGTAISAPGCAINSNAGFSLSGGASITTKQVTSAKTVSISGGAAITTAPTTNNVVQNKSGAASDWEGSDTNLQALLCQVNKLTGTSDPDYPGGNTSCTSLLVAPGAGGSTDLNLNYSPSAATGLATYFNSGTNSYTIPYSWITAHYPGGTIQNLNISGGITATFQGPLTLSIKAISMGGTALHFGSGNVSIAGSIVINGGAVVDFDLATGNTITIGATSGTSINVGGGSKICFTLNCVTPVVAAGTFSVGGDIISAGGTTILFPNATTHIIAGNLNLSGNTTFGAGTYIVKGYFTNNTGGATVGANVTFGLGGTFTLSGGTSLDLSAPTSASSYGIPGILIATKSTAATTIGGGSSDKYAGLLYAPKSDITVSGGGSISASGSSCLMMIVNTLTLSGGGTTSTGGCSSLTTTGTTASVSLFK